MEIRREAGQERMGRRRLLKEIGFSGAGKARLNLVNCREGGKMLK